MRQEWHKTSSRAELRAWKRRRPWPLVLAPIRGSRRHELTPATRRGGFGVDDMERARHAFAHGSAREERDIHPRLLEILYRAVRHFEAPYVHVISGFRPTRATSRHAQGRAIDFVLPGVSDDALARFLRQQGFVGVGIYPVSGFVHLDVRSRSYFWVDRSGPDEPNAERSILASVSVHMDRRARARREVPVPDEGREEAGDTERPTAGVVEADGSAAGDDEEATGEVVDADAASGLEGAADAGAARAVGADAGVPP